MYRVVNPFTYKGYRCMITEVTYPKETIDKFKKDFPDISGRISWYCGYIEIPLSEEEKYRDIIDNIMHGGITDEVKYKETVRLGFDLNHEENPNLIRNNLLKPIFGPWRILSQVRK